MIDWFPTAQVGAHHNPTFLGDMICKWSNANTTLTLYKLTWPGHTRPSYHVHVEDVGSNATPVSIGINRGLDDIDDLVAKVLANAAQPKDLLALILKYNLDVEPLICAHSPKTERLSIEADTPPPP